MTDLTSTIEARSDQLNADDLMGGPRTVTITKVSANTSSTEQPIAINYEGDNKKPFFPCKTVRRLLVSVWGSNGADYVGRSMTLYRDPSVKWGGLEVGGIRVSHVSNIDTPITIALTATRGSKKPFTVRPLVIEARQTDPVTEYGKILAANLKSMTFTELGEWWQSTEPMRVDFPTDRLDRMNAAVAKALEGN